WCIGPVHRLYIAKVVGCRTTFCTSWKVRFNCLVQMLIYETVC
ncbi:unnamed protein product, partial [Mycena citricolor]